MDRLYVGCATAARSGVRSGRLSEERQAPGVNRSAAHSLGEPVAQVPSHSSGQFEVVAAQRPSSRLRNGMEEEFEIGKPPPFVRTVQRLMFTAFLPVVALAAQCPADPVAGSTTGSPVRVSLRGDRMSAQRPSIGRPRRSRSNPLPVDAERHDARDLAPCPITWAPRPFVGLETLG